MKDTHTKRIVAWGQSHIGNVGLTIVGLDPHIIEAFQTIGETGLVVHATIIGSHQYGELVLMVLQGDATLIIE